MKCEESKKFAIKLFEDLGYKVDLIPESNIQSQKRADLQASFANEILIIETKSKDQDPEFSKLLTEVEINGIADCLRTVKAKNSISSVIERAKRQLDSTPAPENSARILFISCLHKDWKFVFDAFRYGLYGLQDLGLFRMNESKRGIPDFCGIRPCFYYCWSDFLRFRSIDAVIQAGPEGFSILVNEFGDHVNQLRETRLYIKAKAGNVIYDPPSLRERKEAVAILDFSLKNEEAKENYIFNTYGYKSNHTSGYYFNGMVSFPVVPKK